MAKPKTMVMLLLFLTGCAAMPDVERSYRECLTYGGSPNYAVAADMRKMDCKR
jgi:hypothetical protein